MRVNSGQAPSTLISKYVGSDFDKVKVVADNIEYIKEVAEIVNGIPTQGYIGATPPSKPLNGTEWYCTTDGRSYVWYEDEDSGQWVESSPQSDIKEGQHYFGNWNPNDQQYPASENYNGLWDVVLNSGQSSVQFDNKTWVSGDKLSYYADTGVYTQIPTFSGVASVNGYKGVVELSAADISADASGTADSVVSQHEAKQSAHQISGVSGLQQVLDSKENSGMATSTVSSHEAKAAAHAISGVAGLQAALDEKYSPDNKPTATDVGARPSTWVPNFSDVSSKPTTLSGYGITDAAPSSHVGATGTAHGVATTLVAGFMSVADKVKLDSMGSGGDYTHPVSGVTTGTYKSVTVDINGHITAGTNPTTLSGYGITDAVSTTSRGVANGIATLDASGLVPSTQLPSYVDDVLEYANLGALPVTGEAGKIYVTSDNNKIFRWSGSAYIEISSGAGNSDSAMKLVTARTISTTGDATWSVSFDGSTDVSSAITLANTGVTAGTYKSVTVDAKGRVTSGTNPTTLAGYGITNAVVNTRTINGKSLTANITLTAADVGAIEATVATTTTDGLMSSTDKTKLNGIATGANAYVHPTSDGSLHVPATGTTNNGKFLKSGATAGSLAWTTIVKNDVGLSNVDNTSDLDKPISTVTQNALNGKANTAHTHTAADVGALASTGTAAAATKLATARTIAGKSFDGTANISITAADVGAVSTSSSSTLSANLYTAGFIQFTSTLATVGIANSFGRNIVRGSSVATNVFGNATDDMYFDGNSLTAWKVRYNSNLYNIYHTGNKPTPAEIGAQPATSDIRVKSNIESLAPVLDKVMLIDPKTFNMNNREGRCIGTIAQDWEEEFPEVILSVPSTSLGEAEMLKGIDALGTIGILLKAIQELKTEIDGLKK